MRFRRPPDCRGAAGTARLPRRRALALLGTAAFAAAGATARPARAGLAERFAAAAGGRSRLDHAPWDDLLRRFVRAGEDGLNRVDYGRFRQEGRAALAAYLAALQAVRLARLAPPEQFAFWVNLYNAKTIDIVLDHYPVRSVRDIDISPGLFADGPWGRKVVAVEGVHLSLDEIEHRILRPVWRDPRIHYAVNCAAVGCPNLRPRAYVGAGLEAALDRAARDYVNSPRGVAIEGGRMILSRIYDWYAADFGSTLAERIEHLTRYAAPPLAAAIRRTGRVHGYRYDWSLNDV